ncbi:MAG: RHS repeat-associated core domain-containing protein [Pyrinomonadaceae bacterium]
MLNGQVYLPFGEELGAGTGGRTTAQGYSVSDGVRQHFTSKERDNETGLDYFGARYYSSTQGRFTSVDIAGPDLINPQSLNKYAYTLNNPLRYVDPKGLYEEDVHLQLTYALGMAAGFTARDAWNIALGDQGVDDDPNRSPMTVFGVEARRNYHFTTQARRDELWGDFVSASGAYTGPNNNNESALDSLGTFLHAEQDSYSHAGYGPVLGHLSAGHAPDKTYTDPAKADRMAEDTYNRLTTAATVLYNNHKISFQYKPLEWKVVKPLVQAFNRARTPEEKQKALTQLKTLAQQNLQQQAQEAIRKKEEKERRKHHQQ